MTMVVFTVVFGHIARLSSGDVTPYAVMVYGGLLPWTLFSSVFGDASASVMGNSNLISKVYFPRMIVPLSTIIVALIDFAVSLSDPRRPDDLVPVRAGLADIPAAGVRRCSRCLPASGPRSGRRRSS